MKQGKFPPGWNDQRVRRVIEHYEQQADEEVIAEDEAAFEDSTQTGMEVPKELVPKFRELTATNASRDGLV